MADEPAVDPRFDPRFQRGYDHSRHPVPGSEPKPDPGPDAVPPPQEAARRSAVPPGEEPTAPAPETLPDLHVDELAAEEPGGRNPYRLALLLVSAGLLVLGGAVTAWVYANPSRFLYGSAEESAFGWFIDHLTQVGPVATTVAGLIGLALWLAVGALDARSGIRPASRPEPSGDD